MKSFPLERWKRRAKETEQLLALLLDAPDKALVNLWDEQLRNDGWFRTSFKLDRDTVRSHRLARDIAACVDLRAKLGARPAESADKMMADGAKALITLVKRITDRDKLNQTVRSYTSSLPGLSVLEQFFEEIVDRVWRELPQRPARRAMKEAVNAVFGQAKVDVLAGRPVADIVSELKNAMNVQVAEIAKKLDIPAPSETPDFTADIEEQVFEAFGRRQAKAFHAAQIAAFQDMLTVFDPPQQDPLLMAAAKSLGDDLRSLPTSGKNNASLADESFAWAICLLIDHWRPLKVSQLERGVFRPGDPARISENPRSYLVGLLRRVVYYPEIGPAKNSKESKFSGAAQGAAKLFAATTGPVSGSSPFRQPRKSG